jgi:hypothetical protein
MENRKFKIITAQQEYADQVYKSEKQVLSFEEWYPLWCYEQGYFYDVASSNWEEE